MEKKLQDYIQYYIGCKCVRADTTSTGCQYDRDAYDCDPLSRAPYYIGSDSGYYWVREIKPILRKLDSLTDDEIKGFINWDSINAAYKNVSFERCIDGIVVYYSIDAGDEHGGLFPHTHKITFHSYSPFEWRYLLSKQFDLFNLIKDGLAIDASTLTK